MTTTEQKSPAILEMTSGMEFTVGTNLTGGLASAAWRVLLPGLELSHVLFLGRPKAATLSVFAELAERMTVLENNDAQENHPDITFDLLALDADQRIGLADNCADLIVVVNERYLQRFIDCDVFAAECYRVLSPSGVLYCEAGQQEWRANQAHIRKAGFARSASYWVTPFKGELRTAFPAGNSKMAAYLFKNVLFGQSTKKKMLSRSAELLSRITVLPKVAPRRSIFLTKTMTSDHPQQVPEYLLGLAEQNRLDFRGLQCGLSARGKFNANKSIFYLFEPDADEAKYVVKMTRAPEFNFRLENEYHSLSAIQNKNYVAPESYPSPLFLGHHAGLVVSAQKAVHAQPFRARTSATATCPIAKDAIDWIVQLGAASAGEQTTTGTQVAMKLDHLLSQFQAIYQLPENEFQFLQQQLEQIRVHPQAFPLVFQHGDLGSWNILVGNDDKVIVLDWEAGEIGMPLWDFYYFIRSYAMWMCRVKGQRDSLQNFSNMFLAPSDISALFSGTLARYTEQVGLARELAAPLFYACWVHRSLKEAMRLEQDTLLSGHYVSLLRLCIERYTDLIGLFETKK